MLEFYTQTVANSCCSDALVKIKSNAARIVSEINEKWKKSNYTRKIFDVKEKKFLEGSREIFSSENCKCKKKPQVPSKKTTKTPKPPKKEKVDEDRGKKKKKLGRPMKPFKNLKPRQQRAKVSHLVRQYSTEVLQKALTVSIHKDGKRNAAKMINESIQNTKKMVDAVENLNNTSNSIVEDQVRALLIHF